MITPTYSMTSTERVLPRLALDFTTSVLDPRVALTRAGNTATVTDSAGVIVAVNADVPRFDYDPVTLACKGLLIEETRTNRLLNSLLDGTSLATQTVTVTAAAHTLSFYGTGSVVLTGTHSATVTGTGAYPTRTTYTFTPTSGSLTLTVSGTVQFANLELGGFATSFIPTDGTTKTRNPDIAMMTGTNFSDWFNASEGSAVVQANIFGVSTTSTGFSMYDSTISSNYIYVQTRPSFGTPSLIRVAGVQQLTIGSFTYTQPCTVAMAYKTNSFAASVNGAIPTTDNTLTLPVVDRAQIGGASSTDVVNGHIRKVFYYPQRLTNAEVQAFSK